MSSQKWAQRDQRAEIKGLSDSDSRCRSRSDDEIIGARGEGRGGDGGGGRPSGRNPAGLGAAANLQGDKVNPSPNLVTPRLIFFRDDLHWERYLTPEPYVTDSRGGRGLL